MRVLFGKLRLVLDEVIFFFITLWVWTNHFRLLRMYYQFSKDYNTRIPRIARPRTVADKFLFRKILDHAPYYRQLSDKIRVKYWIEAAFPEFKTPKTLWIGKSVSDLPSRFIGQQALLKSNHSNAQVIDLSDTDLALSDVQAQSKDWLKHRHWIANYEWGYYGIKPYYFVEEKLQTDQAYLTELKFNTFGPRVPFFRFATSLNGQKYRTSFTMNPDGSFQRDDDVFPAASYQKVMDVDPEFDASLLEKVKNIGRQFDQVRVDIYLVGAQPYIGELTFFNRTGHFEHNSFEEDNLFNNPWDIREAWFFQTKQNWFLERYKAAYFRWSERQGEAPPAKLDYDFGVLPDVRPT